MKQISEATNTTTSTPKTVKTKVVYVYPQHAKFVKTEFEKRGFLDKRCRMVSTTMDQEKHRVVAIPITPDCEHFILHDSSSKDLSEYIVRIDSCECPMSSAVLGNRRYHCIAASSSLEDDGWTMIHQAILDTMTQSKLTCLKHEEKELISSIRTFNCPKTCEKLGNDTIILPCNAPSLLCSILKKEDLPEKQERFFQNLARLYNSKRIVQKGGIDPNSPIRESRHVILWPNNPSWKIYGVPDETGPGSPGWITITEQGIHQSYDLTRVMFSRGNISEKIRTGKNLVKPNDVVLDMYAGIGYYTLPSLKHGHAKHVYACEWNQEAVRALKYNLKQNGVEGRCTVLEGDCRVVLPKEESRLRDKMDRVFLGLLPSSEGGWPTAIRALRKDIGGHFHIHGNVATHERIQWAKWICYRLQNLLERENWKVICYHIEKVKSFAPKIDHLVADVFLGPFGKKDFEEICGNALILNGDVIPCNDFVEPPSCALNPNGILCQKWMMG